MGDLGQNLKRKDPATVTDLTLMEKPVILPIVRPLNCDLISTFSEIFQTKLSMIPRSKLGCICRNRHNKATPTLQEPQLQKKNWASYPRVAQSWTGGPGLY